MQIILLCGDGRSEYSCNHTTTISVEEFHGYRTRRLGEYNAERAPAYCVLPQPTITNLCAQRGVMGESSPWERPLVQLWNVQGFR
ncbi:jg27578 [Pararge aegeria aegeria]|uniref:Jg27578 protein n=1 Tax=Pararge aegeria aegeria TaxID=348720 RepID=A0A8S4SMW9_9NEOP|nr:jg27578 [Pararge aegeria aegeria]